MKITIEVEYKIGEIVYLKTDNNQEKRIITGYNIKPDLTALYRLSCGMNETVHYDLEISRDRDIF